MHSGRQQAVPLWQHRAHFDQTQSIKIITNIQCDVPESVRLAAATTFALLPTHTCSATCSLGGFLIAEGEKGTSSAADTTRTSWRIWDLCLAVSRCERTDSIRGGPRGSGQRSNKRSTEKGPLTDAMAAARGALLRDPVVARMRSFLGPSVWVEFSPLAARTGAVNLGTSPFPERSHGHS